MADSKQQPIPLKPTPPAPISQQPQASADANQKKMTLAKVLHNDPNFQRALREALPKNIDPKHVTRLAISAYEKTPKLKICSFASVVNCLMDCAALGLEPDGRRAHLIPYGDKCTLVIDYKGLVDIVMRSGLVRRIHVDVVCENDQFDYNLGEVTLHKVDWHHPRGTVYAAYAMVELRDGARQYQVMSKVEIDAIRSQSKSANDGPWVTHYNEMAKKTVFKRLCKWLSLSPEIDRVVNGSDQSPDVFEAESRQVLTAQDFPQLGMDAGYETF